MTESIGGPLAGVRVVDITVNLSGPFSTLILAQQGADVSIPCLRVAFLEAGIGWIRWYADRLDEAAESAQTSNGLSHEPHEHVYGGNCFFSSEPDAPGLEDMVRAIGEDIVVFASDYPHVDCSFPRTADKIAEHLADPELVRKVTVDNGRHLYGKVLHDVSEGQ
jgi:predicted TIM-barrel fold metal-dependent hydrolase